MDSHGQGMVIDDSPRLALPGHCVNSNDLELSAATKGNLGDLGGNHMVRMFRRLVRGGGRQRVVGLWII